MQRVSRLAILLLIPGATVLALYAQQNAQKPIEEPSQSFAQILPLVPPISGEPITATFVIQVQQPLPGGGYETWYSITNVARDSSGRTQQELHRLVPSSSGEPPLLYTVLTDPRAHLRRTLDPVRRSVWTRPFRFTPYSESYSGIPIGEDIGSKIIGGIEVKGIRRTWVIPTQVSASGKPGRAVDETWYSSELQMIVSERQTDSLGRVVTVTMSHVDRAQPRASLFKVPDHGYNLPSPQPDAGWSVNPPDWDPNISGSDSPFAVGSQLFQVH